MWPVGAGVVNDNACRHPESRRDDDLTSALTWVMISSDLTNSDHSAGRPAAVLD